MMGKKTLKAEKENVNESKIILVQYNVDVYDPSALLKKCQPCRINVWVYAENKLLLNFLLEN